MLRRISDYMPSSFPFGFKLATPKQMLSNIQKMVFAAILYSGLCYATTKAEGGPVTGLMCFISCMGATTAASSGAFIPMSVTTCNLICAAATANPFLP